MVRLGRDIEDRTVVSTTPLTSVIAGKFTGGADKKPSCKRVATTSVGSREYGLNKVPVNRAEFYFVSPLLRIHSPPLEE